MAEPTPDQAMRVAYVRGLAEQAAQRLLRSLATRDTDELCRMVGEAGGFIGKAEREITKADLG